MATRMNCREVARRIQTYLDGELDEARRSALQAHLDACVDCGLEADVFDSIKKDLAAASPPRDDAAIARLRSFTDGIAGRANA